MNSIKVQNRILPKAKLPFNLVKGSVKERELAAGSCWNKFVDEFVKIKKPDINDYRKCINKALEPNKVSYKVSPETNPDFYGSAGMDVKIEQRSMNKFFFNYTNHKIGLPIDEDGKILVKSTAVHKARHLFDNLYQPKTTLLRTQHINNTPEFDAYTYNLWDIVVGTVRDKFNEKEFQAEVDEILSELPRDIAIETLQDCRYAIQSERRAYYSEILYLIKENPIGNVNRLKNAYLNFKNCNFNERESYIAEKLKNLIAEERNNIKTNANKKPEK